MRSWSVISGGQSSLTMCRLDLNFKILCEILICHTQGIQSSMTMCRLNLNFKILCKILICHTQGVQSSLTMFRLNLNIKILDEILVFHACGGINHLWPCAGYIRTLKFYVRSSSFILGVQSSLTMCRLNLNFEILCKILICHTQGGQSCLTMCRLNLNFKILDEILVCHIWGVNHLWPCAD